VPPRPRRRARRIVGLALLAAALLPLAGCYPILRYRFKHELAAPDADFVTALTIASGTEAVDGNRVVLLENGVRAFPAMLDAIRGAQRSVHFETFIFHDGEIGREFVAALAERARAGVEVRLLLDAIGSASFGDANRRKLEAAGAKVFFFQPIRLNMLRRVHLRTHRKVLIVDGVRGFTGGICIDDAWQGDADRRDRWRETELEVEGPVVRHMQIAFAKAWLEATGELLADRDLYPRFAPTTEGVSAQLIDSTPDHLTNPARLNVLIAAAAARQSLDITNSYFVPDRPTREALVRAARRGVRLRLLLPGKLTDAGPVRHAGRVYYARLLAAGVEIWEYLPARLHAKTMVVDGKWSTIGSVNLDRRSFAWNYESNLNVFDEPFAAEMTAMFERDLARSRHLDLESWRRRPLKDRLRERLWALFRAWY
jgi:cardiolipin synthase A/B